MNTTHILSGFAIPALLALGSLDASAEVSTIYQDDFSGEVGTSLNGQAPSIRPGSETWSFNSATSFASGFQANGTVNAGGGVPDGRVAALLPFTPQPGNIYTLSATVSATTAVGQWIAFGFADRLTGASGLFAFGNVNGLSWMLKGDNSAFQGFAGPRNTNEGTPSPLFSTWTGNPVNMRIVLDTTGAAWTTSMFNGETQRGATYTYTTNPAIQAVGFSKVDTVGGSVDNFKLTVQNVGVVLSGFEAWASTNGIEGEPFDGDKDGDGLSNGMEYALGLDPVTPGVVMPSPLIAANGTLTISFEKGPDAAADEEIRYAIEVSSDLGVTDPWLEVTPTYEDIIEISYEIPQNDPRQFARLKVERTQ